MSYQPSFRICARQRVSRGGFFLLLISFHALVKSMASSFLLFFGYQDSQLRTLLAHQSASFYSDEYLGGQFVRDSGLTFSTLLHWRLVRNHLKLT